MINRNSIISPNSESASGYIDFNIKSLSNIQDLDISSAQNSESLVYNGSQWVASGVTGGGGGASALDDLTDVSVPNPSGGQALVYDGTEWIAANAPVLADVHNQTGGALTKGTAVYITGTHSSGKPTVGLANSTTNHPSIGLVHADIADGEDGWIIIGGDLDHVDTSSFGAGDALYISTTDGQLTSTRPTSSDEQVQKVGLVGRSHATVGHILVIGAGRTNDVPNEITVLTGVALDDKHLGSLSGQIVPDNVPIKDALNYLEAAIESSGVASIQELNDIGNVNTTPTDTQALVYNATDQEWQASGINLQGLADVEIYGVANSGQQLIYDGAGSWIASESIVSDDKIVMVRTQRVSVGASTSHINIPADKEYFQLRVRLLGSASSEFYLQANELGSGYIKTGYGTDDQAQTLLLQSLANPGVLGLPIGGTSATDNGGGVTATFDIYNPQNAALSPVIQYQTASTSGNGLDGGQILSSMMTESVLVDAPGVTVSGVNISTPTSNGIQPGSYVEIYEPLSVAAMVSGSANTLGLLQDVSVDGALNSESLVYNGSTWVASGVTGGGGTSLTDGSYTGQPLTWNGSSWEPSTQLIMNHSNAGHSILVNHANGSSNAVNINTDKNVEAVALNVRKHGTGSALAMDIRSAADSNPTLQVRPSGTGSGAHGIFIAHHANGTGRGLNIDMNGSTGRGIHVGECNNVGIYVDQPATSAGNGMTIVQKANQRGFYVSKTSTGSGDGIRIDYDGTDSGLRVNNDGTARAAIFESDADFDVVLFEAESLSYDEDIIQTLSTRTSNSAFRHIECISASDVEFYVRGDGLVRSDQAAGTPADYAELFETVDPSGMEFGLAVQVDPANPGKIVPATSIEHMVGFTSAAPAFLADAGWSRWKDQYQRTKFGAYLLDENGDRVLNPEYDPELEYIPREERPEWVAVGLVGKIWVQSQDTDMVAGELATLGNDGKVRRATAQDSVKWPVLEVREYEQADGYQVVRVMYK
jgi:hypothetical protein